MLIFCIALNDHTEQNANISHSICTDQNAVYIAQNAPFDQDSHIAQNDYIA